MQAIPEWLIVFRERVWLAPHVFGMQAAKGSELNYVVLPKEVSHNIVGQRLLDKTQQGENAGQKEFRRLFAV